jgi:acyl-CoA synthetase (AMP-forming)/AMP-acid ligase II
MGDALYNLLTFDEFLRHWADERPDRPALSEADRSLTYAQLEDQTARIASMLLAAGLAKGDRIAWIGKNSDLYFALFYGAARVGIVMVPIGWRLAPAEWEYIVNDTRAKLLFTGAGFEGVASQLDGKLPYVERVIGEAEARSMIAETRRTEFATAGPDDAVLQLYTSGTTGNPKGAVLSNRNLFALRKHAEGSDQAYTKWDDDEVVLVAMPCAHIGGTGLGIMAVASGLPALVLPEFTPDAVFDAIEHCGVTRLFIVPAALHIMLQQPRCTQVDYSRLKYSTAQRRCRSNCCGSASRSSTPNSSRFTA